MRTGSIREQWRWVAAFVLVVAASGVVSCSQKAAPTAAQQTACSQGASCAQKPTTASDWPMYGYSLGRNGFNGAEVSITPASMSRVRLKWDILAAPGTLVTAQPVVANGLIYWGSWNGIEHTTHLDGTPAWTANLGESPPPPGCPGGAHSLLGAAAIAPVTIGGRTITALFVGGGKATFYALNAATGMMLWQRHLGTGEADIWSSPLVYRGSVYTSTAGWGDCPGTQGKLFQLDAVTGAIKHTFGVVPNGCIGGGIWGSMTVDVRNGTLYVATGNDGPCPRAEPDAIALVQLRASDLTLMSAWQLPPAARFGDSDFGATPTLFTATIGGIRRTLLGVPNKNGIYYAFDEAQIAKGPVWQAKVAVVGDAPETGKGSISSSAWDGTRLYEAGGNTTINGHACKGSVRALNPATGAFIWQSCLQEGFVLGAVTAAPGVIVAGAGSTLVVLAASDGHALATVRDNDGGFNIFYGGAAIAEGMVYIGNANGTLLAYEPAGDHL